MIKNSIKKKRSIVIIVIGLVVALISYLNIVVIEDRKIKRELESIERSNQSAYENYIESTKDIVNSDKKTEQMLVFELSKEVLEKIDKGHFIQNGSEYLSNLEKKARENLNSALNSLLTGYLDRRHYDKIKYFADNETYVNEENIILFNEKRESYEKAMSTRNQATIEEAEKEAKKRVYIGMTKEQVLATNWGEPDDINRIINSYGTSEQWVYSNYGKYLYFEDGVLVTIQD